jgi:hypothetical protein
VLKQAFLILLVFISFQGISQSVKISKCSNLEVMQTDLGKMTWDEANKACEKLGDGWRLPTIEELFFVFENRNKIRELKEGNYWTSEESVDEYAWYAFDDGVAYYDFKYSKNYVRAVRDIK